MKLTTYLRNGTPRLAALAGADLIDLNDANPATPADLRLALKAGVDLHAAARAAMDSRTPRQPLAGVTL